MRQFALVAATKVLQDLSIKMAQVDPDVKPGPLNGNVLPEVTARAAKGPAPRRLIDGGASHALRQAP